MIESKQKFFARLGVLYFAHPEVLKRELPQAYEVCHELFRLSRSSPVNNEYIRSKIWTTSRGIAENGVQPPTKQNNGRNDARSIKNQSTSELERLRNAVAQILKSPRTGKKTNL